MARGRRESTSSKAEGEEMAAVVVEDGETSSDSLSEPDVDLLEMENEDEMGDEEETEDEEEEEEEAAAQAEAEVAAQAAAARYNDGIAAQLGNGGMILVLFEMPSGFAIFRYNGIKLLLPDACQNIWADFVDDYVAKDVVRLLVDGVFEDKHSAINEDTGVSEALAKMIVLHREPEEKLAVGNQDYQKIIESKMGIVCLCSPAVDELMWGLKISMGNFVPAERSGLTNKDRIQMSQGMQSFLNSHSFDIKPDMMVTKQIIEMAARLNECDQCVNKYKYFLLAAADHIMKISRIDTKDWDLLKVATALMMICCPEEKIAAPQGLFLREQLKIFRKHAPQYENKISKIPLSVAYNKIYLARKVRYMVARPLFRLIKHDRKTYEAELASDHEIGMMSHQQQMAPPSRGSANGFSNPKLDREGSGRHENKTDLVRSSSGGLGAGVVLKMAQVIKDGSARGQRHAADVVKEPNTMIIPARELAQVFAKDEESSSYIFDSTDTSANIQTNNVRQPTSDESSNKPFSVGENRLEKLSKDSNESLGKRKVQPENNLSGGGRPLISEGLDGPPSSSHAYEPLSSAPETPDLTVSVKHPSAVGPVTSYQRPGSSASECIAEKSFASALVLSPSTPIGSLTKSTMNPNAKEFKLNPNAKSFIPSASLRPPHPPASDASCYYPNNMLAAPLGPGLPVGMGFPPAYGGQPVMCNTQPGRPPHRVTCILPGRR